jgi:hypothetical protein
VAIPSGTLSGNRNGTLALEIPTHRRHRVLGEYLNAYVHVLGPQTSCNTPALLLPGQLVKDQSARLPKVPKQGFPPPFGDEDDVILAISPAMRQALRGCGHRVLLASAHQATRGALYSRNAQSYASRTGQTSGLPQRLS